MEYGGADVLEALDGLRELNIASVLVRLLISMVAGGMIGLERGRRNRPAGMRTYMIISMGAALSMLISQYLLLMSENSWADVIQLVGSRQDITRLSAQVISGIGFLGAGTILVTSHQEVKGLTTAACLWASACMGLAVGAGFYECALLSIVLIFICVHSLRPIENFLVDNARNMNIYVEFESLDDVKEIIGCLKENGASIYGIELGHGSVKDLKRASGTFTVRLKERHRHSEILAKISGLRDILMVDEI